MSTPMGLIMHANDKQLGIVDVPSEIQTALKNQCINFNIALLSLTNEHAVELNKIAGDKTLSDLGKSSKRTDLLDTFTGKIAKIAEEARLWRARAENFRAQIKRDESTVMPPAGDPVTESRCREIRDLLRGVDQPERIRIFSAAVAAGDFETQAAIERSPRPFPLLENDILSRLVEDRRRRSHPIQCSNAQSLDDAGEWLDGACAVARQRLSR